ncbi:MAG: pilus assembly protein [Candidatus Gastranaerophilales bacterium]|nr:pilus assembly protein [Candidatus Gastranaerophilales bacterium]
MQRRKDKEKGMITVEAVLSLVPFIIVVLGIISFINIFMVHNKIQFAIQQMGNELSCYTYFYQALGIRAGDMALNGEIDTQTVGVDNALEDVGNFFDAMGDLGDSYEAMGNASLSNPQEAADAAGNFGDALQNAGETGGQAIDSVIGLAKDPRGTMRGFVYLAMEMGEEAGKSLLLDLISAGMIDPYLETGSTVGLVMTADEYLRYFGVKDGKAGLDFGESSLFSKNALSDHLSFRIIDIVVEYDIEVYILKLFWKEPTIHVVQRCSVPAWLDGDGQTYYSN